MAENTAEAKAATEIEGTYREVNLVSCEVCCPIYTVRKRDVCVYRHCLGGELGQACRCYVGFALVPVEPDDPDSSHVFRVECAWPEDARGREDP